MADNDRTKRNNLLLSYYNTNNNDLASDSPNFGPGDNHIAKNASENHNNTKDPNDINSSTFTSDLFLRNLIKVLSF
jgi:hypothetical protein